MRATTETLMRLSAVQAIFPVSRAVWYEGIRTGRYPAPVKISARAVAWRRSDIEKLIEAVCKDGGDEH